MDNKRCITYFFSLLSGKNSYLETSFLCLTTSSTDSLSLQMDTVAREAAREARITAAKARRLELGMDGLHLVGWAAHFPQSVSHHLSAGLWSN